MLPELGNLVDLRHVNVYGTVYGLSDAAINLGFVIGIKCIINSRNWNLLVIEALGKTSLKYR